MLCAQHLDLRHLLIVSARMGKKLDQLGLKSFISLACDGKQFTSSRTQSWWHGEPLGWMG